MRYSLHLIDENGKICVNCDVTDVETAGLVASEGSINLFFYGLICVSYNLHSEKNYRSHITRRSIFQSCTLVGDMSLNKNNYIRLKACREQRN